MPRAYAPRLATVQRADTAARALGITGWHLIGPARGQSSPRLHWRDADGLHVLTLAEAEERAARTRPD